MSDIQYDPACVDCRRDAGRDVAGTTWQCYPHVQAERDSLWLALAEATRERDNWTETARTYAKGEDYYRGLIDAALKDDPAAYVADDGSISEDVLRAKLPEMYALAVTERKRAEAEFDRLRQDRYDALNAQTTEGLSAAEWQLRTGKAERERDEARALAVSWEREFNVANHERLRLWDEAENLCERLDQFEAAGFPNVASVLDRIALLSRARETDGAVREAAERLGRELSMHIATTPVHVVAAIQALLSALSSPPRPETKGTVMAPSMFGAGLLVPTRPMAFAPPADAATEAVPFGACGRSHCRAVSHSVADGLCRSCSTALSTPAPAPSAKETS